MNLDRKAILDDARRALGIDDLVLVIHDASFPSRPDEDTGRGSPYSRGARDLLLWAREQGFTGVQLGPQGETSALNPSPYDGSAFTKTILSVALWPLAYDRSWEGVLDPRTLESIVEGAPASKREHVPYAYVYEVQRHAVREAYARLDPNGALARRFAEFRRANSGWLEREARYAALAVLHGTDDWRRWPSTTEVPSVLEEGVFAFGQFLVHTQHAELLAWANQNGIRLFGDLQIGIALSDLWQRESLFLRDWRLGAPPSRTNPEGQPWGYAVFDPRSTEASAFLRARLEKMLSEFHGVRIDHPHGHVCPWIYRDDVKNGRRMFESPDDPDLARFAIARPDQIDFEVPRYADEWVTSLDDAQIDAYAQRFDMLVETGATIVCEVLSTCPYPLLRVMQRHGLGRFRVTQKADPGKPNDVYRTDQAVRADWVMLGNHDTPPISVVTERWTEERQRAWRDYLRARGTLEGSLPQSMLADLLACDAAHVSVFFPDLLGLRETYNVPGVVDETNWTLRVHTGQTPLDLPKALATALRAKGHPVLAERIRSLEPANVTA